MKDNESYNFVFIQTELDSTCATGIYEFSRQYFSQKGFVVWFTNFKFKETLLYGISS